MHTFADFIERLNSAVWGAPTLTLIIAVGVYYTVRLRFFQFSKLRLWLSNTLFAIFRKKEVLRGGGKNGFSQFQAMATSLAATVGTGNIAGVAAAIATGGPGAVFWMWFCSLFSMMTSYAENTLGIFYRTEDENGKRLGGPMYYLRDGLSKSRFSAKLGKTLAFLFSVFTLFASFGIGNMTQSNSISLSLYSSFGVSKYIVGVVTAALTLFVILGGSVRIGKLTEKLVPFMALFYIIASLCIVASNFREIPGVLYGILKSAFSPAAATGGFAGAALKRCISTGFRRGVFSNEAGLGSSVMVGSSSSVKEPAVQGMWGIFQVFTDTLVICSVTAFVLLCVSVKTVPLSSALKNGESLQYISLADEKDGKTRLCDTTERQVLSVSPSGGIIQSNDTTFINVMALRKTQSGFTLEKIEGASLVSLAFNSVFGKWADVILSVAVTLFAFSTIIGWSFYGERSIEFLTNGRGKTLYRAVFSALTFLGAVSKLSLVWSISDVFNGLMAVPNLIGVILLSGDVLKITKNYLDRKKGKNLSPLLNVRSTY